MTRYCVWGGRPGYVWIGSHTDRAMQRRHKRWREAMAHLAGQVGTLQAAMGNLMLGAVPAAKAMSTLAANLERWQRIERRRQRAQWPLWRDYSR